MPPVRGRTPDVGCRPFASAIPPAGSDGRRRRATRRPPPRPNAPTWSPASIAASGWNGRAGTVGEVAQAWLERGTGHKGRWDASTRERCERCVRRYIEASPDPTQSPLGAVKFRNLTPDRIAARSQANERALARTTALLALIALRQILRYAMRQGWIGVNP